MPNKQGGKNYKKSKHAEDAPVLYEVLSGQMYGRILKLLGGCNAIVYCNDGRERICHIRGNMRRKVWIEIGDIVLISLRELDNSGQTSSDNVNRGDICAKYDSRVIHRLQQKDPSINPKLFTSIEKIDGSNLKSGKGPDDEDENGFVFENTDSNNNQLNDGSVDDENSVESDSELEKVQFTNRLAQKKQMVADFNDDELDIDDI